MVGADLVGGVNGDAALRALEDARLRAAAGLPVTTVEGLPPTARRLLDVADDVGAPLLDALDAAAQVAADEDRTRRAVHVAAAQGRAVTAGLLAAPLLLVPTFTRLFDLDLVGYHRTPLGRTTGLVALALLALGALVAWRAVARIGTPPSRPAGGRVGAIAAGGLLGTLVHPLAGVATAVVLWRRASRTPPPAPETAETAELAAVGVAGGLSAAAALRRAADAQPALAVPLRRLAFDLELGREPEPAPGLGRLAEVCHTAVGLGAPLGPSLRRLAAQQRAEDLTRVLAAAERLPVQLTFPTALALLPGVLLLVGAPIVHDALAAAAP